MLHCRSTRGGWVGGTKKAWVWVGLGQWKWAGRKRTKKGASESWAVEFLHWFLHARIHSYHSCWHHDKMRKGGVLGVGLGWKKGWEGDVGDGKWGEVEQLSSLILSLMILSAFPLRVRRPQLSWNQRNKNQFAKPSEMEKKPSSTHAHVKHTARKGPFNNYQASCPDFPPSFSPAINLHTTQKLTCPTHLLAWNEWPDS